MKKYAMAMLLVAAGLFAKAQSTKVSATDTKATATITAAVEKLRLAMISGVKQDLESVLSKDLAYGHSSGKIETKGEFVQAIVTRKSDFKSIDIRDQTVTTQGDLAVVRHFLDAETNDGGVKGNVHLGIVLVFKKVKNEWLLCSRNAFRVPVA